MNAAVHATAALLGGGGPEAGVGAGHAREAVRVPVDLEGNLVRAEEGCQDGGAGAALGSRVRRVGRKGRRRRVGGQPGWVGLRIGVNLAGARVADRRDGPP